MPPAVCPPTLRILIAPWDPGVYTFSVKDPVPLPPTHSHLPSCRRPRPRASYSCPRNMLGALEQLLQSSWFRLIIWVVWKVCMQGRSFSPSTSFVTESVGSLYPLRFVGALRIYLYTYSYGVEHYGIERRELSSAWRIGLSCCQTILQRY